MAKVKNNIRQQVYISERMDDELDNLCELMGLTKNELIRYAISNLILGYSKSVELVREEVEKNASLTTIR